MPPQEDEPQKKLPAKAPVDLSPFKKHAVLLKFLFGIVAIRDPALVRFVLWIFLGSFLGFILIVIGGFSLAFARDPEFVELVIQRLFEPERE